MKLARAAILLGSVQCGASVAQVSLEDTIVHQVTGGNNHGLGLAHGDVNGDGYRDLAVSDPGYQQLMTRAWILLGPDYEQQIPLQIPDLARWDFFPGLGDPFFLEDLNGDSLDDLLMSARFSTAGTKEKLVGRVLISLAPDFDEWIELQHPLPGETVEFGKSAVVHDFDGDGVTDVAIGSPSAQGVRGLPAIGRIDIFSGVDLTQPPIHTLQPPPEEQFLDRWGTVLALADWDGSGEKELLTNDRPPDAPVPGPMFSWIDPQSGEQLASWDTTQHGFYTNAFLQDLNGDGSVDYVASDSDDTAVIAFGPDFVEQKYFKAPADDSSSAWGFGLAAGDINRDGHKDLLIGSPELDGMEGGIAFGRVRIYYGPIFNKPQDLWGAHPYAQFGIGIRTADLNGDGFDEIFVGAGGEFGGNVHLFQHKTLRVLGDTDLSLSAGGTVEYSIEVGPLGGDRLYLLLLGASGSVPGVAFPLPTGSVHVPLNPDALTRLALSQANLPMFEDFLGTTDSDGNASPKLNAAPLLDPALLGITVTAAGVLFDQTGVLDYATDPAEVILLP